jgi:hypothetical protein
VTIILENVAKLFSLCKRDRMLICHGEIVEPIKHYIFKAAKFPPPPFGHLLIRRILCLLQLK